MKHFYKILLLFCILLLWQNVQAQFPFYGFELNNYEVGDTLEYLHTNVELPHYGGPVTCSYYDLYVILNKQTFGTDSVRYTVSDLDTVLCPGLGGSRYTDTFPITLSNAAVYNNNNNFNRVFLGPLDTNLFVNYRDSLHYDTVYGGLKNLTYKVSNGSTYAYFYAVQNIGVMNYDIVNPNPEYNESYTLLYFHLAHYGVYGNYQYIPNAVATPAAGATATLFYASGKAWLNISGLNPSPPAVLTLYDLLGREVKSFPVRNGVNLVDMNLLSAELYIYRIQSGNFTLATGKVGGY